MKHSAGILPFVYLIFVATANSAGLGPLSPATTNRTEEGRAKHRRVELLEQ